MEATRASLKSAPLRTEEQHNFEYSNLSEPSEIRLVILESGSRDAPLRCRLIHVSLDDNPEYDALSYVWGDISVQDPAILLDGKPFQVGVNLSAALLNIRHEDLDDPKESRIWIDAICINQTNVTERNQQVQQMDRIYSRAMKVLIWLGRYYEPEDDELDFEENIWGFIPAGEDTQEWVERAVRRMKFFKDICPNSDSPGINTFPMSLFSMDSQTRDLITDFAYIRRLFARKWFTRIWVIQEFVLARTTLVLCERSSFSWKNMWDGASMIRVMIAGFAAASFDSPWPRILAAINPLSLVGLEILRNARYSNLYVIYSMLVRRECKDPRDRVYAIRGICSATYKFEVNYDKSIEEVGVDWSWSEICKTKTLDIFTTCNSHQLKPSWVPNLRNPSQNRDVSLDKSRDGHIPYSASGRLSCDAKLSESRLQLTLTGLPIDHVAHVIDSRVTQKAAELAEHLLQESSKDQISQETREKLILFEDFINFLACYPDREVFGADFLCIKFLEFIIISYLGIEWSDRTKTFPVAERLANVIFRGFRRTSASGNSYTTLAHYMEWWNSSPIPADYRPDEGDTSRREAYFSDLKLAMQLHLRNMHIIVTSSGRIGLFIATCEVLVGDHIYVLLGGKTPFILRKGGERYELVTSCYLENFMDGEAITEWEAKRIVSEEITLV